MKKKNTWTCRQSVFTSTAKPAPAEIQVILHQATGTTILRYRVNKLMARLQMRGSETRASRCSVKEITKKKELSFSKHPPNWIKKAQMLDKRACTMADMIY